MTYQHIFLIIFLGGILPLFPARYFYPGRLLGMLGIAAGCVGGFILTLFNLTASRVATFSYQLASGLPFSFKVDLLALFFLSPLFLVGAAAALYSYQYLDDSRKRDRIAFHYLFLALLIISMAGVLLADSMISFAFFWEAMSVVSAALVLFDYEEVDNRRAAYRYFLYTQAGGLCIFLSFGLLFSASGTVLLLAPAGLSSGLRFAIFFLALVGFGSKAGLVPLHVWLPHAHPAAPSHVSALMSGVMIKLGIYGLLRMFTLLSPDPETVGRIFIALGAASGLTGILFALGQHNLKRLLAYSSVENTGLILLGCGLGFIGMGRGNTVMAVLGLTGGLLHVWNHALIKSVLFLGAGSVLHGTGTLSLDRLGGLLKRMPKTGIAFFAGALAICGLPPLNGFVSEFLIYAAGFHGVGGNGLDLLFSVLVIVSLAVIGGLSIACFSKVFGVVFLGEPRYNLQGHEAGRTMLLPMALLALLCLIIGLVPVLFVRPALAVAGILVRQSPAVPLPALAFCSNLALGGAGLLLLLAILYLLRRLVYRHRVIGSAPTWGCGFSRPSARMQYTASSYARSIVLLFRPLPTLASQHEEIGGVFPVSSAYRSKVLDFFELAGEHLLGSSLTWCSARLRVIQHGNIQLYIAYIVLAVIILLLFQIG